MKALVVYYTRTGYTKAVAKKVSESLDCDIEEIVDNKKRAGIIGLTGAVLNPKGPTTIKDMKTDPKNYEMMIIGTPVWWYTCTPAVTAFFKKYGNQVKKAAFFYTCGADNRIHAFADMEKQLGKEPVATLGLEMKETVNVDTVKKFGEFLRKVGKG